MENYKGISIEKLAVQAQYRALKATWVFETETPPPPTKIAPRHKVFLTWDKDTQQSTDHILEWLKEHFEEDRYYYDGEIHDHTFWVFSFFRENDAIAFKLRWG